MNTDPKFQQLWEYRKKDDDVDSSSDDSKSNSSCEPVQKKHKVLSDLVLYKEDEESDTPVPQPSVPTTTPLQIVEASNIETASGKKKIAVANRTKGNSEKKRKRTVKQTKEPAQLVDLKPFTESLLKELQVARRKMFLRMKKQMTRLTAAKSALGKERKEGKIDTAIQLNENCSGMKTKDCSRGLIERPRRSNKASGPRKPPKAIEKKTNHEQAPVTIGMEKRESLSLPVKKPTNDSDQTISSSNLTLPNILSKPQTESTRTEFSSSDHIHAGCAMNKTNILERANFLTDAQNDHGYIPIIRPDEQFGSLSKMSSKSIGMFEWQRNPIPNMNPGLQVPLHQWPNNCLSITSQIVLAAPGQENSSVGLRMNNGETRFPGRSNALSESFLTNSISCNLKSNIDAGLVSFGSQDIKGENILPSN